MLAEFSLEHAYSTMCGKNYQIYAALNLGIFSHAPSTHNLPLSSYRSTIGREKLLIYPGSIFSKICFLQQRKVIEKTMIYFIKIQWKIWRWLRTLDCLYFAWFKIFQMWWLYSFVNNIYLNEKLLISKNFVNYNYMYIEERGWAKFKFFSPIVNTLKNSGY